MLTLTRKTDYALISLAHLAAEGGRCASAREIAEKYGMPLPLLMNVLKTLTQKGLVRSVRGPHGGYTLSRLPTEISLIDIICAIEGPVHLVNCLGKRVNVGRCTQAEQSEAAMHLNDGKSESVIRLNGEQDINEGAVATLTEADAAGKSRNGNRPKGSCDLTACCPVRPSIHKVHAKLVQFLSEVTLAEL